MCGCCGHARLCAVLCALRNLLSCVWISVALKAVLLCVHSSQTVQLCMKPQIDVCSCSSLYMLFQKSLALLYVCICILSLTWWSSYTIFGVWSFFLKHCRCAVCHTLLVKVCQRGSVKWFLLSLRLDIKPMISALCSFWTDFNRRKKRKIREKPDFFRRARAYARAQEGSQHCRPP